MTTILVRRVKSWGEIAPIRPPIRPPNSIDGSARLSLLFAVNGHWQVTSKPTQRCLSKENSVTVERINSSKNKSLTADEKGKPGRATYAVYRRPANERKEHRKS